jgi:hypothetical protein
MLRYPSYCTDEKSEAQRSEVWERLPVTQLIKDDSEPGRRLATLSFSTTTVVFLIKHPSKQTPGHLTSALN